MSTPSAAPRPKLLVQWWNRPTISPGRLSWVDDLIRAAGGENALTENVKSRPLSDEEVCALEPDALVISWCGVGPGQIPARRAVLQPHVAKFERRA